VKSLKPLNIHKALEEIIEEYFEISQDCKAQIEKLEKKLDKESNIKILFKNVRIKKSKGFKF
jgi:hypothetical protein